MNINIPLEVLFYIIPFGVLFCTGLKHSSSNSYMGSDRGWHYMLLFFPTLCLSLLIHVVYWGVVK